MTYDDFGTQPIETVDWSGLTDIVIGLKGVPSQVRFEVSDDKGNKASSLLLGVNPDTEGIWSVPTSFFAQKGVDLTHVRLALCVIEGTDQTGILDIYVIPSITPQEAIIYRQSASGTVAPSMSAEDIWQVAVRNTELPELDSPTFVTWWDPVTRQPITVFNHIHNLIILENELYNAAIRGQGNAQEVVARRRDQRVEQLSPEKINAFIEYYKKIAESQFGDKCFASPAFVDGRIYVRGAKNIYAIGFNKD